MQNFLLLNFMIFLLSYFSSLSRFLWMMALPLTALTSCHNLMSSANLLKHVTCPMIKNVNEDMKNRNGTSPSTDPLGNPVVTESCLLHHWQWQLKTKLVLQNWVFVYGKFYYLELRQFWHLKGGTKCRPEPASAEMSCYTPRQDIFFM